jgi:hypothetical protein
MSDQPVAETSTYTGMMMEAVRTSETSVDNHFTRQYIPEDSSEQQEVMFTLPCHYDVISVSSLH